METELTEEQAKKIFKEYLEEIKNQNTEEFNIFRIIDMREKSHSNFLSWLLNININEENNTLQKIFLKKFLEKIKENTDKKFDVDEIVETRAENKELVVTEHPVEDGKIDIFITFPEAKLNIVIENKLDAKIGKDQLNKYKNCIKKDYKYPNTNIFILNTVYSKNYEKEIKDDYIVFEYSDIILILFDILNGEEIVELNEDIRKILWQYVHYWENNDKYDGYTKIIDGHFIWNVCEKFIPNFAKQYNESPENTQKAKLKSIISKYLQ